jgi:hypothetical protein
MSRLAALQREFQSWVLGEGGDAASRVRSTAAGSAEARLRIYAEAMRLRFLEVLSEDFPGVHGLLGDETFSRLGREYAAAFPSAHRSIRWFGQHLPRFLAEVPPWCQQPVLAEMASFEWCKGELVDAADADPVSVAEIAALPAERWGEMRPAFVPAVRRIHLRFNVPSLWCALDAGQAPPAPAYSDPARTWLLWRKGLAIHWRPVDPDEAWMLERSDAGASFARLCRELCRRHGEDGAPLRAATVLRQWASDEILAAL